MSKFSNFFKTKASTPIAANIAKSAAPVLSKATGTVTAAGTALGNVGQAAAWQATKSVFDSFEDPGFILFVAGLLTFFFSKLIANDYLSLALATIFMFFSALFVFKGRGLIFPTLFWFLYIFLGGKLDLTTLLYSSLPILFLSMVAHGLFAILSKKNTFSEGSIGELIGLIPVIFFLLDIGLLNFLELYLKIHLSALTKSLLFFMPWWATLGIFTTKKENFIISICKLVAVVYIFLLLTIGIVPNAYTNYTSALPGPEQLLKAKQELQPKGENPALSNLICLFEESTNAPACVERRQEESQIKAICTETEGSIEGTSAYDNCVKKQKEERAKQAVNGIEDPTIKKPFLAEFKESKFFPKELVHRIDDPVKINYPLEFDINNPRGDALELEFSCLFKPTNKGENITGLIIDTDKPGAKWKVETGKELAKTTITCQLPEGKELNGSYTLIYQAKLLGLTTVSRLQRAFINSELPPKEKETLMTDIMKAHFPYQTYLSQAPADLARINFAFGNPLENPIIESGKGGLSLAATVENLGSGKLLKIKHYQLKLENFDVEPNCLESTDIPLPEEKMALKEGYYLQNCLINSLPPELQLPGSDYLYKEFEAELEYDYLITKELNIKVKLY